MADFFDAPQPAAKLKHAILRGYLPVFATKTASATQDRRAVYIDGYAGRGEYCDEAQTPGSPLIALDIRDELASQKPPKTLDCWFVEPKGDYFEFLQGLVAERGAADRAWRGTIQKHVAALMQVAAGAPLFAFLDPFGMGLPISSLIEMLDRPRARSTELLLNFSIEALRREAGMIASDNVSAAGTRDAIDANLNGTYWRDWLKPNDLESEHRVADEYCRQIEAAAGGRYSTWMIPVSDKWQGRPIYFLILVTAHVQGAWFFLDALRRALPDYYVAVEELSLFDPDALEDQAKVAMRANVLRLLEQHGSFIIGDRLREVYDDAIGKGGGPHLREVLRSLKAEGMIADPPTGDLWRYRVSPGSGPTDADDPDDDHPTLF